MSTTPWNATAYATHSNVDYDGSHMDNAAYGSASGSLVDGGICDSSGSWSGKIVLCERGSISFLDKVTNAENGGADGTIVFNNEPGMLLGTLGDTDTSSNPAIGMSQADGQWLRANALGDNVSVTSTNSFPGSGYEAWDGTSMATPHVAGVAALVWSHFASASNDDIRNALAATAEDRGAAGRDNAYGHGIVKALDAYTYLGGGTPDPTPTPGPNPDPTPTPTPAARTDA